ncbi:hypothetical protein SDC9_128451 [bioreactor metagenome]|uniref:Uncharacterized protein n=1 Tax=bioreactor metagenome TaxID=1076179 RepID=A0A645CX20_9ZZZZ
MLIDCSETEYKMLCDIASAASESELIYQLSVLQPLVSGYDYLSSGKRASVELAFIRMCHPQSQPTASLDALSARIDKLESRLDGGGYEAAPKLPSDKGEKAEKIAPKQKIAAEESKQAPSVSSGTYPESRRLLQSLKGEAIIYPYLESAKFICRDQNTLAVLTESFTNGILSYMKAEDIILRYVKNITPEITAVRLESEQRKKEPDAIDSL